MTPSKSKPPVKRKPAPRAAKSAAPKRAARKPHEDPAPDMTIPFAERHAAEIEKIMSRYPVRRSGVMSVLYLAQKDYGWIPPEIMTEIADLCEMQPAEVLEMVSFYTMYHRKPAGKNVFWVCGTLPCALCGADGLTDYLKEKLSVALNDVTEDGLFTIKRAECLGACSEAPLMLVNETLHTKLTRKKVDEIIDQCRKQAGKGRP